MSLDRIFKSVLHPVYGISIGADFLHSSRKRRLNLGKICYSWFISRCSIFVLDDLYFVDLVVVDLAFRFIVLYAFFLPALIFPVPSHILAEN